MNKTIKEFADRLKKYDLRLDRAGDHYVVYHTKKGEVVHDDKGPITVHATPSDRRTIPNYMARLRRAGVVPDSPLVRPETQARKLEAIQLRHNAELRKTDEVRAILEPVIVTLGGWGRAPGQVTVIGMARASMAWAERNGRLGFTSVHAAEQIFESLKLGRAISDANRQVAMNFVRDMSRQRDPRAWYDALLSPAPEPVAISAESDELELTTDEDVSVALRAFYWMAKGSNSPEDVIPLMREIEQLERKARG